MEANYEGGKKQFTQSEGWMQNQKVEEHNSEHIPVMNDTVENTRCEKKQGITPKTGNRKTEPAKFTFKKRGELEENEMEELVRKLTAPLP